MASNTGFYVKRGSRYKPISYYDVDHAILMQAMPKGAHVTIIDDNGRYTSYNINPADAAVYVAVMRHRYRLTDAIQQAFASKVQAQITQEARDELQAWQDKHGIASPVSWKFQSANDVLDALVQAVQSVVDGHD